MRDPNLNFEHAFRRHSFERMIHIIFFFRRDMTAGGSVFVVFFSRLPETLPYGTRDSLSCKYTLYNYNIKSHIRLPLNHDAVGTTSKLFVNLFT